MAKLGFLDRWGDLHSVAHRCQQEGHTVRYCIRTSKPEHATIGDGIVPKAASLAGLLEQRPDAIVTYQSPEQASAIRAAGIPTWGSSETARTLEEDRAAALKLARECGLSVSETREFDRMDDAYAFLASTPIDGWVFKAEGADNACASTQVCKTRDATRIALSQQRDAKRFVLQEIVHGVEVSCEGWFDHRAGGWLRPFNSTLERKRLMVGDVGPNTGCMGSVVWTWPGDDPRLPREVLMPFTRYLDRAMYVGPMDVNSIIGTCSRCGTDHDPHTPHWLEFTPRLGWNAFEAAMMLVPEGKLGAWCVALGRGDAHDVPMQRDVYGVAVRLLTRKTRNTPVVAPWRASRNVFVKDVMWDGTMLRTTGTDTDCGFTVVFEVGAVAPTVYDATKTIYKQIIPRVMVPDVTYRDDIGVQAERDLDTLASLGYETRDMAAGAGVPTVYATLGRERSYRSA